MKWQHRNCDHNTIDKEQVWTTTQMDHNTNGIRAIRLP